MEETKIAMKWIYFIFTFIFITPIFIALYYYLKNRVFILKNTVKQEKHEKILKMFDIDMMIKLGHGFLIEDKFDKRDEEELSILLNQINIKIEGFFEKEIEFKHHIFNLKRYTFDSPNMKQSVYVLSHKNNYRKYFSWQFNEIVEFLELEDQKY